MILPLGTISPDTASPFPNYYGMGYGVGGRMTPRPPAADQSPPAKEVVRDTITLSPAAQRIMDQAQRLEKTQRNEE